MKSEFEMLRVSDMVHKKVYALRFLRKIYGCRTEKCSLKICFLKLPF